MKFDSIQDALRWYFDRPWIRPPADARSMQPIKISTSPRMEDTEAVMATFLRVEGILGQLPGRDWCILREEFHRKGRTQVETATEYSLSERHVRRIRDQLVERLQPDFQKHGLLAEHRYEEMVRIGGLE